MPSSRSDTATASAAFTVEAAAGRQSYLRAAQAYMLISMPTGTSTIFGAFQAIRGLPKVLSATSRGAKPRAASGAVQASIRLPSASVSILRGCISLSDKTSSLLVKHALRDTGLCDAPRVESTPNAPALSATFVGRCGVRLDPVGPLSRRRLALHLPLCILGRRRSFTACTIHRAGRRMLAGVAR